MGSTESPLIVPRYRLPNEIEVRQVGYVSQFLWLTSDGATEVDYHLESLAALESDRAQRRPRRRRSEVERPTVLTAPIDAVLESSAPNSPSRDEVGETPGAGEEGPTGLDPID